MLALRTLKSSLKLNPTSNAERQAEVKIYAVATPIGSYCLSEEGSTNDKKRGNDDIDTEDSCERDKK